ncbi:DNA replication licensing factor MCM4 [Raphidocelis subcapitata]|uniref:DNA replication licensing factor MCM4 n=1 Tax=Raphidocelis subcapitata TaxID=307507 RepID=A0A2V0PB20_9CHLO|nr:DNA replication licensing factor MCM4 [Raphidocelis subcapitata]|eukprot:GBF94367.1 DNA replication licensing factor MCM4 [Raphidocelis subcapitata]
MQEDPSSVPEGETPRSLLMYAFDTNVDGCKPGDKVTMTGIFRATRLRVNPRQRAVHALFKTYLDVVHVDRGDGGTRAFTAAPPAPRPEAGSEPTPADATQPPFGDVAGANITREEAAAKERSFRAMASDPDHVAMMVRSVAPKVIDMDGVKKGLLCQLFGGVSKCTGGPGGKGGIRGDINVLVVGDPSVSKSQLLAFVHHVAPRGIYTSGKGSSAVGLTAYVTKDPETNEMVLESGALVLSDQGICCIDEFDKMSDGARAMLHEVMEQQTVSVAKAGLVSQLNARTSILACANPKGSRYLPELSLSENINLPPTLLSRFDLLYLVLDARSEARDRALGRHLVSLFQRELPDSARPPYTVQELREFIAFARARITPRFTDGAAAALVARYKQLRRQGRTAQVVVATPRQLEALIRLSEAWARMHLREEVVEGDVTAAYNLWYDAISVSAADESGRLDIDTLTTGASAAQQRFLQELPALLRGTLAEMFQQKPSCSVNELLEAYNAGLAAQDQQAQQQAQQQQQGADGGGGGAAAARRRRVTVKQLLAALYQLTDACSVRGMVVTARRAGAGGGGDE